MERNNELEVMGYLYLQKEDVQLVVKEQKMIEEDQKLLATMKSQDILEHYKKMVAKKTFKSPLGMEYLRIIYRKLAKQFPGEDVPPIPWQVSFVPKLRSLYEEKKGPTQRQVTSLKKTRRISIFLNFILLAAVVAMFVITLQSDNPNIINYKTSILNKYASWEQELEERERAIKEKELELLYEIE